MDLGLSQRELAQRFGVHARTVHYWETGQDRPRARSVVKIVEFLGFNPIPHSGERLPEALKDYRTRNGLTQEMLADVLGVRPEAVSTWETEQCRPKPHNLKKIWRLVQR